MPQNLTGLSAAAGFARGFGPQFAASRKQKLERERQGLKDQEDNWAKAIKIMQDLGLEDTPRYQEIQMQRLSGLVPGFGATPQRTQLQQQRSEFVRGIGPTVTGYREHEKIGAPTGPVPQLPSPKLPTASNIAFARRQMEKYQKDIDEANRNLEAMKRDLKLAPGEKPKTPGGLGKKGEQITLDNWNMWEKRLDTATASLDSLRRESAKRGIDLEFGAPTLPTPGDVSKMSEEEILRMIGTGGR